MTCWPFRTRVLLTLWGKELMSLPELETLEPLPSSSDPLKPISDDGDKSDGDGDNGEGDAEVCE
jgi:hypothetical protein